MTQYLISVMETAETRETPSPEMEKIFADVGALVEETRERHEEAGR